MPLERALGVAELTAYLRRVLEGDPLLSDLWVRGEVTNLRRPASGHTYFTLQEGGAALRCVLFRSYARRLDTTLEDGKDVLAHGYLSLYAPGGTYQLYLDLVRPGGQGAAALALELLKRKLAAEGLFDPDRKKPLPLLPRAVGLVTSLSGAVLHDVFTVTARRYPGLTVVVAPAAVQGEAAPGEVAAALDRLNAFGGVDVIIVARGGGSWEDLGAFNTEEVARAIARSAIPVIAAVGHETDVTVADLVADRRAATPSAAAEMAVPLREELQDRVAYCSHRLDAALSQRLVQARRHLEALLAGSVFRRPDSLLASRRQELDNLSWRLEKAGASYLAERKLSLGNLASRLEDLSPLATLARGYAVCRRASGEVLLDAAAVEVAAEVEVVLHRGTLDCLVKGVREGC